MCARRAQTSSTQELRDHFAGLARTWIRLADDLERTLAILDAEEDETEPERVEPDKPAKKSPSAREQTLGLSQLDKVH
jgi:hypothetical protein